MKSFRRKLNKYKNLSPTFVEYKKKIGKVFSISFESQHVHRRQDTTMEKRFTTFCMKSYIVLKTRSSIYPVTYADLRL